MPTLRARLRDEIQTLQHQYNWSVPPRRTLEQINLVMRWRALSKLLNHHPPLSDTELLFYYLGLG